MIRDFNSNIVVAISSERILSLSSKENFQWLIIGFMMWPVTKYSILRDIFRGINLQKSRRFQEGDDYKERAILFR